MKEIIDRACDIECVTESDAKAVAALADLAIQLQSRLESLEKDAASLHGEIMNIAPSPYGCSSDSTEMQLAYKIGHRDARHASAELVAAMQANKGE